MKRFFGEKKSRSFCGRVKNSFFFFEVNALRPTTRNKRKDKMNENYNLHICRRQFVGYEPDGQSARPPRRFRFGGHGRAEPEQAIRRSSGPGPAVVAQFSGRFDHVAGCSSVVGQSAHVGRFAVGPTVDRQFGSAAASAGNAGYR